MGDQVSANDDPSKETGDEAQTTKDRAYSPASEREMRVRDEDQSTHASGIDHDDVELVPGTGGPDDQGDVDVDPSELHVPHGGDAENRPV